MGSEIGHFHFRIYRNSLETGVIPMYRGNPRATYSYLRKPICNRYSGTKAAPLGWVLAVVYDLHSEQHESCDIINCIELVGEFISVIQFEK